MFDDTPFFAERQVELLREYQRNGLHLIQRKENGQWVRIAPDGTETILDID